MDRRACWVISLNRTGHAQDGEPTTIFHRPLSFFFLREIKRKKIVHEWKDLGLKSCSGTWETFWIESRRTHGRPPREPSYQDEVVEQLVPKRENAGDREEEGGARSQRRNERQAEAAWAEGRLPLCVTDNFTCYGKEDPINNVSRPVKSRVQVDPECVGDVAGGCGLVRNLLPSH